MKIMAIAIFEFLVMASISAGGTLDLFGSSAATAVNVTASNFSDQVVNNATQNINAISPPYGSWSYYLASAWAAIGMIFQSAYMLLLILIHTLTIGFYFQSFFPFIPTAWASVITLGADAMLMLGIAQWFSGRASKVQT
jgi:hypothetical protein